MGMKLKHLIDTLLSPEIEALPYVERYGGLVQTMHLIADNGTENGVSKRYPVACDVTSRDCTNTGIYQDLIPNDSRKSVVYWEEISPLRNKGVTKTKDFYTRKFVGTARLVFWANLSQLGIDNCNDLFFAIPQLEKIITKKGKILVGDFEGFQFWIQSLGEAPKNIETIFGKYDYPKTVQYYLYPNDYFALDVQFELHQCLSKGGSFPDLPAILCPNGAFDKCNYILNYIGDELKLSCVLPTYDFSDSETQNAISEQQKDDLKTWLCDIAPINSSIELDGVNEYIQGVTYGGYNLERTDPFTFSMWVKMTGGTVFPLLSKWFPFSGYMIRLFSDGRVVVTMDTGAPLIGRRISIVSNVGDFPFNEWGYFTFSYDGSLFATGIKSYTNAVEFTYNPSPQDNLTAPFTMQNTRTVKIGAEPTIGQFGEGLIYDFKIWDVALSPSEVLQQYNLDLADIANNKVLSNTVRPLNLFDWNTMGKNAGFGTISWAFDNNSNNFDFGTDSVNMEKGDRNQTDKPT